MQRLVILLLVVFGISVKAQTTSASGDTIFNQTDAQGLKQGFWKVKYDNGELRYSAFFIDNKPLGKMIRYFDDGSLEAIMFFDKSGIARTRLYFQDGPLAAIGNYKNMQKDSTWTYYSYYTKTLSDRETYVHGKKQGMSISYFSDGKIADESEWKLGVRDGIWKQYFDNDVLKMSTSFTNGKRNGDFVLYYPDKQIEWKGTYQDDMREGTWVHYDPTGKIDATIEYKDGEASNQAELDTKEQEIFKAIEKQKGKIPEPDETNFLTPTPNK